MSVCDAVNVFVAETSRWSDKSHGCTIPQRPVGTSLESLWDVLPEAHKDSSSPWDWDVGSTSSTITSLLQDLSLKEGLQSTAPPTKRQCRSLSCSDELGSRSSWRPQGSRLWTAVEKRRCHSGGSVQRGGIGTAQLGFPAMQRSSSFSLPARCNALELACVSQCGPCPSAPFTSLTLFSSEPSEPPPPLYLSHEQICLPEPRGASPPSSPDSTPELERRSGQGGLARSRSQPCVLNDKKIGMKRRRPADSQKQRPSLDLAKMTQVGDGATGPSVKLLSFPSSTTGEISSFHVGEKHTHTHTKNTAKVTSCPPPHASERLYRRCY